MFYGIALVGAFQFSLMVKLEPVFTALFSWVVLSEVLNFSQYFGMLLVVGSLIAYQYYEAKNATKKMNDN
jgi:drug/metabolite transporter (DMT)-like permease